MAVDTDTFGSPADALDFVLVDAFARKPGEGNRAAVAVLPGSMPSAGLMADIARFLGEPATVFVAQAPDDPDHRVMRWFAPSGELPSCGHGTLAAAYVVIGMGAVAPVIFETALGVITTRDREGMIEIDMPAQELTEWAVDPAIREWLGADVADAARSQRHGLVVVDSPRSVHALKPDLARLAQLPVTGLAVTAPMDGHRYDIVSRWFVPRLGLEDQATGTAHCLLGPYWTPRLGVSSLRARQASQNGADIDLTVSGNRVLLAGGGLEAGRRLVSLSQIPDGAGGRKA